MDGDVIGHEGMMAMLIYLNYGKIWFLRIDTDRRLFTDPRCLSRCDVIVTFLFDTIFII